MYNDVIPYRLSNLYGNVTLLVQPYRGKFRDHPMMIAVTPDNMAEMTDVALLRVFEKLTIYSTDMLLRIGWNDENSIFAITKTINDGRETQVILYSVPSYINMYGWMTNLFDEITHETAHAIMQYYCGERLVLFPPWWREGLSLNIAWPQGQTRAFMMYAVQNHSTEELTQPLGAAPLLAAEYPAAYYAVRLVVERHGWDAVRRINERVSTNEEFKPVFEEITGMPFTQFQSELNKYIEIELSKFDSAKAVNKYAMQFRRV